MCGIAGLVDPALASADIRRVLPRMTRTLVHRGPDDEGFYAGDAIGLGMRRLSIVDRAGGQQPMASEDGHVQVVFNGEIYNYRNLRMRLRARGHALRTNADTEVIAHLYEEQGVEAFADLRGMFAIAIWDARARRLVLARDRLGKKPLFYAQRGSRLLFGSEIKAILAADPSLSEPDVESLTPYFQHGFIREPRTMFRGIRKLPAAHWLVFEHGALTLAPYWRLDFGDPRATYPDSRKVTEELDALIEESVRIRLMSDVPLGIFLSGGLDSSTIVAYAHKAGLRPLKTFTIGFDRPQWDESADAQIVARHLRTDHHVLTLREQDMAQSLPETIQQLVRHFDEPFGDPSALPTYYVSKLAREHVTVILSGDGGDELFAGYSSYRGLRFAQSYQRLPQWLGRRSLPAVVEYGAGWLPPGHRYGALRAARVLRDSELPFEARYFAKRSVCRPHLLRQLLAEDLAARSLGSECELLSDDIRQVLSSSLPDVSKASYLDLRIGLLDGMLVKVDRMSMAHALEVRSPLLDHHLVEFVVRLPPSLKLRGWQTKAVLRDTVRRYLPPATLRKPKQGFSMPLREWFRTSLHEMVGDYLEPGSGCLPKELFDHATIQTLLRQHGRGEADHSRVIWLLLNYAVWHDSTANTRSTILRDQAAALTVA